MSGTRRAIVAGAGLMAVVLLTGCPAVGPSSSGRSSAREKGAAEATAAVAAGKLELREYPPLPAPASHAEYIALLRERGIEYSVPGLPPGRAEADFMEEVRGWNGVMEAEIDRKLGAGTVGRLREEAENRWKAKIEAGKKR